MKPIENLLEPISLERQERFLNPQMSDHFKTFICGKYGYRLYTIKIGRKWVMMRSNNHRARIALNKYKTLAFREWRESALSDTLKLNNNIKPREWWVDYGFTSNPQDVLLERKHLTWR
tara:strand:- start:12 stop:365 length:354 start_codon:yes stop_codon:yes gene_type:complete